jgi:hypothetical protein
MAIFMIANLISIFSPSREGEDSELPPGNLSNKGMDGVGDNNKNYSSVSCLLGSGSCRQIKE